MRRNIDLGTKTIAAGKNGIFRASAIGTFHQVKINHDNIWPCQIYIKLEKDGKTEMLVPGFDRQALALIQKGMKPSTNMTNSLYRMINSIPNIFHTEAETDGSNLGIVNQTSIDLGETTSLEFGKIYPMYNVSTIIVDIGQIKLDAKDKIIVEIRSGDSESADVSVELIEKIKTFDNDFYIKLNKFETNHEAKEEVDFIMVVPYDFDGTTSEMGWSKLSINDSGNFVTTKLREGKIKVSGDKTDVDISIDSFLEYVGDELSGNDMLKPIMVMEYDGYGEDIQFQMTNDGTYDSVAVYGQVKIL